MLERELLEHELLDPEFPGASFTACRTHELLLECLHFEPNVNRQRPYIGLGIKGAPILPPPLVPQRPATTGGGGSWRSGSQYSRGLSSTAPSLWSGTGTLRRERTLERTRDLDASSSARSPQQPLLSEVDHEARLSVSFQNVHQDDAESSRSEDEDDEAAVNTNANTSAQDEGSSLVNSDDEEVGSSPMMTSLWQRRSTTHNCRRASDGSPRARSPPRRQSAFAAFSDKARHGAGNRAREDDNEGNTSRSSSPRTPSRVSFCLPGQLKARRLSLAANMCSSRWEDSLRRDAAQAQRSTPKRRASNPTTSGGSFSGRRDSGAALQLLQQQQHQHQQQQSHQGGGKAGSKQPPPLRRSGGRRSVLQTLRLSPRLARMTTLNELRRKQAQEASTAVVEHGHMPEEMRQYAEVAFQRHFGRSSSKGGSAPGHVTDLSAESRLLEALGDCGIKANTRPEKLALQEGLAAYVCEIDFDLKDFMEIINDVRSKFKIARSSANFMAWRKIDTQDSLEIDAPQLRQFLKDLGLGPTDGVASEYDTLIRKVNRETRSRITFNDAEEVVQQARELFERSRRREERSIQEEQQLPKELFNDFRSQIVELWGSYAQLREDGRLTVTGIMDLLTEYGFITSRNTPCRVSVSESVSKAAEDGWEFSFIWLLRFIQLLRKMQIETRAEEVKRLFHRYDGDHNMELDMREVNNILVDVNLQPRTAQEQQGIAQLIEEVDVDGSGQLSLDELDYMVQRIEEKFLHIERSNEYEIAAQLNFSKSEVDELRRAFYDLDQSGTGELGSSDIRNVISMLTKIRMSEVKARHLLRMFDFDLNGVLDFGEFMTLLTKVDFDMKLGIAPHALPGPAAIPTEPLGPAAAAALAPAPKPEPQVPAHELREVKAPRRISFAGVDMNKMDAAVGSVKAATTEATAGASGASMPPLVQPLPPPDSNPEWDRRKQQRLQSLGLGGRFSTSKGAEKRR